MKKIAVFDIDGTLIRWQLYHAVVEAIAKPSPDILASIKEIRSQWKTRSRRDSFKIYELELVKIFESSLAELTPEEYTKAIDSVFEQHKDQVYTYTRDLVTKLKKQGYLLFAISGSHAEIVGRIAAYYGFDDFIGSTYEQRAGHFTGKVKVARFNKHRSLQKLIDKYGASTVDSVGVGDSESDASFLNMVEQPIAFNPDRDLLEIARAKGWKIVVERKNVIFELEPKNGSYILAKTD
jgi:HAD superfamily hydrolase (TIGR01490 family)